MSAYRFHVARAGETDDHGRTVTLCGKDYPSAYVFDAPVSGQPMCDRCVVVWERSSSGLTISAAAERLGVSRVRVYQLVREGRLVVTSPANRTRDATTGRFSPSTARIDRASVERYAAERRAS